MQNRNRRDARCHCAVPPIGVSSCKMESDDIPDLTTSLEKEEEVRGENYNRRRERKNEFFVV